MRPSFTAQPRLSSQLPLALYGPGPQWRTLASLRPLAPRLVDWAQLTLVAAGLDPAHLPAKSQVALVLLQGVPGQDSPTAACRATLSALVDGLEDEMAEHGAYPQQLDRPARCPLGGQVTYSCQGSDFCLECGHMRYSTLQGYASVQAPAGGWALILVEVPGLEGQPLEGATVLGLDKARMAANLQQLLAVRRALAGAQQLSFHLQGRLLGQKLECLEGTCRPDRLEVFAWGVGPGDVQASRSQLLETLAALPADAPFAMALPPALADQLGLPGFKLNGMDAREESHLWDSFKGLCQGEPVGLASQLELDGASAAAALNRLRSGRLPVWAVVPVSSRQAGQQFLDGSPVVRRRIVQAQIAQTSAARLRDGRLELALGSSDFPAGPPSPGQLLPGDLPGEPAAAGWLRWSQGRRTCRVAWAAGAQAAGLWMVLEKSPCPPPTARRVPTLTAGNEDPEAAQDPIAWDTDSAAQ